MNTVKERVRWGEVLCGKVCWQSTSDLIVLHWSIAFQDCGSGQLLGKVLKFKAPQFQLVHNKLSPTVAISVNHLWTKSVLGFQGVPNFPCGTQLDAPRAADILLKCTLSNLPTYCNSILCQISWKQHSSAVSLGGQCAQVSKSSIVKKKITDN